MKQAHIIYSGRVQGVGFRFTTIDIAKGFNLTGWVKNLRDGSVEVVAEGPEDDLKEFMQNLDDSFGGYIRDTQISWLPASGEFKDFSIEYH